MGLAEIRFIDVGEDLGSCLHEHTVPHPTSDAARPTRNHRDFAFKLS